MSDPPAYPISPSDDDLSAAIGELRTAFPSLDIVKLLNELKYRHPEWTVSEKRLRKLLHALNPPASIITQDVQDVSQPPQEADLVAETGLDPSIDVGNIAPKIKARLFGGEKGKGLVAREKLQRGEMLWQEEPWIVTTDPNFHDLLLTKRACSQCFTIFSRPDPPLSIGCSQCDTAHFCNRLCLSRARSSSAHHDLLCPGRNPASLRLLTHIHEQRARHLEAAVRIIALWRGEREAGEHDKASDIERRVWGGMARVSIEAKEMERREWELVGETRQSMWKTSHALLLDALHPSPKSATYRQFQKAAAGKKRFNSLPLTDTEIQRWFSYSSFLELLGLATLNQEDSGGLYALHAHLNHSCEPNVQCRNLPKAYIPPPLSALPCDLPPPNAPDVRGTNKLTFLARRNIHPGEELTVPHVNFDLPRSERRRLLRENFGFWCSCPKCVRQKGQKEESTVIGELDKTRGISPNPNGVSAAEEDERRDFLTMMEKMQNGQISGRAEDLLERVKRMDVSGPAKHLNPASDKYLDHAHNANEQACDCGH